MGRTAVIERALGDAVELRALARAAAAEGSPAAARLTRIARRRADDVGPSVPKSRAAAILGVSLTTLDKWIERGEVPVVRRGRSSRDEVESEAVLELADHVHELREQGRDRALLATAIARRQAVRDQATRPAMGSRNYFPNEHVDRREDLALPPGERVAQAIRLSRTATRIAAAAAGAQRLADRQ